MSETVGLIGGLDIGNGFIKATYSIAGAEKNQKPVMVKFPALYAPLMAEDHAPNPEDTQNGAYIRYLEGDRTDLLDEDYDLGWLIGNPATQIYGESASFVGDIARNMGKVEYGLQMLLASIPEEFLAPKMKFEYLACSLPDTILAPQFIKALKGIHHFERGGEEYTIEIPENRLVVREEGQGAIVYALRVASPPLMDRNPTANPPLEWLTFDIGTGTVILRRYSHTNARPIPGGSVREDKGVRELINSLTQDVQVMNILGCPGDPIAITSAMQRIDANEGRLIYGAQNIDLTKPFKRVARAWIQSTITRMLNKASVQSNRVTHVLFIGGGAALIRHNLENLDSLNIPVRVPQDPQDANSLGLHNAAQAHWEFEFKEKQTLQTK